MFPKQQRNCDNWICFKEEGQTQASLPRDVQTWQGELWSRFAGGWRATPWGKQKSTHERQQAKHRAAEDDLWLSPDKVHLEYLYLNTPSVRNKQQEWETYVQVQSYDVGITEFWRKLTLLEHCDGWTLLYSGEAGRMAAGFSSLLWGSGKEQVADGSAVTPAAMTTNWTTPAIGQPEGWAQWWFPSIQPQQGTVPLEGRYRKAGEGPTVFH